MCKLTIPQALVSSLGDRALTYTCQWHFKLCAPFWSCSSAHTVISITVSWLFQYSPPRGLKDDTNPVVIAPGPGHTEILPDSQNLLKTLCTVDDQIFNSSHFYIEEHYSKLIKKEFSIQDQLGVLVNNNSLQCCLVHVCKKQKTKETISFLFLLLFMLLKDKQQQQLLFICFFILIIHIFTQCLIYKTGGFGTQTGSFSNESRQRKSDRTHK